MTHTYESSDWRLTELLLPFCSSLPGNLMTHTYESSDWRLTELLLPSCSSCQVTWWPTLMSHQIDASRSFSYLFVPVCQVTWWLTLMSHQIDASWSFSYLLVPVFQVIWICSSWLDDRGTVWRQRRCWSCTVVSSWLSAAAPSCCEDPPPAWSSLPMPGLSDVGIPWALLQIGGVPLSFGLLLKQSHVCHVAIAFVSRDNNYATYFYSAIILNDTLWIINVLIRSY